MILATYREFGSLAIPHQARVKLGVTLAVLRSQMRCLPAEFEERGVICLNAHIVPRALWGLVKPKAPAEVTFHCPPAGSGGDGGKNPFAVIAGIALTIATGFIAGGGLATGKFGLGAAFGAGKIGAIALAAGVSYAGSLLISALVPPPSIASARQRDAVQNAGSASADGNQLEPNGTVPRVIGSRKVFPPLMAEPFTYYSGPDEVVEAVYGLAGPHRLADIRVDAAEIGTLTDVDYEVREGWPGDARVTIIGRQSRTDAMQSEIRAHTVSAEDNRTLESATGNIASALPIPQVIATRDAPDEHQLQIMFSGLHKNARDSIRLRVPLRMRMRRIGETDWIDLPELHFQAANIQQLRATIRLVWQDDASTAPSAALSEGFVEARRVSPGQTAAPASAAWAAHPYFTKAGSDWLDGGNLGTSGVDHVLMDRYTASFLLDPAVFPRGRYEVEITRGAVFDRGRYNPNGYTFDGSVWDFFGYRGTPEMIAMARDMVSDTLYLIRSVSIWNEHPLPTDDFAVIAVRARNKPLERLSVLAGGYVQDWNGAAWADWTVTDNPAPHLRDIFAGALNLDPVPLDLIDDVGLVAWRTSCAAKGYRCNALLEDQTVDDAARIVASCGYAKPYMSDIWGVTPDYDRTGEAPVQIFNPRNSAGFQWTKAFPRVPEGFRVGFRDQTRDYDLRQMTVFRPGNSDDTGRTEQVTYEGLVTEAEVVTRAIYDQRQAEHRGTFYSLDAPAEAIVCRRGDLVGVTHDMLTEHHGSARLQDAELVGGKVVALALDMPVRITSEPFMDKVGNLADVADLSALGMSGGVAIRRAGSITVHPVSNATGETDVLTFDPPIDAGGLLDAEGYVRDALVSVGPIGREMIRLIVFGIRPKPNLEFSLTFVDEASQIWNQPDSPGQQAA